MTSVSQTSRSIIWLAIVGALSIVAIAVLWPLQQLGQICPDIYPSPPGCFAEEPRWVPLVGIGLVIALLAAAVIVFFTVPSHRTLLIVLSAAIVLVTVAATVIVMISQTGVWDPVQPPIMLN